MGRVDVQGVFLSVPNRIHLECIAQAEDSANRQQESVQRAVLK